MLTVWEAIKMRRSIRKFAPDDVPEEMIEQLLEAARLAPSAGNSQPWRFLVVRDKETKKELRRIGANQQFLEEAPVVIVCFADPEQLSQQARKKRWKEFVDTGTTATLSGRMADPEFGTRYTSMPDQPLERLLTSTSQSPIANTFIAIENLLLMATGLGLGTCWVGTVSSEFHRLFGVDENLIPIAVIPVGYPAGEIPPQRSRRSLDEIVLKTQVPYAGKKHESD